MQDERLKNFPSSPRREEIESAIVQHLYSLRANEEARSRARAFLKQHPGSLEAANVFITLFRLDVREGLSADVEKRGRVIMGGDIAGSTLSDRQGAARLLAEYLVSIGQPVKALGVYADLYKMTLTRGGRVDVLWRTAIASLRAGNAARAVKELQQVLGLKPDSETQRAASFWLAYAHDATGAKSAARTEWSALAKLHPYSYYGIRAAARSGTPLPPALMFPELTLRDAVKDLPDYQAAALLSRAGMLSGCSSPCPAAECRTTQRRCRGAACGAGVRSRRRLLLVCDVDVSYFGPYLQRPANNLPDDFWALAYPRAYWNDVSAAAYTPRRRPAVDDRSCPSGIPLRSDGAIAGWGRRSLPGDAVHGG